MKEALIQEVENGIESVVHNPPTSEEMERIKRNYRNQSEKLLADSGSFGLELSKIMPLGDWRYFFSAA